MVIMLQFRSFVVGLAKLTGLVVACTLFTTPELCSAQRYYWPTLAEVLRQNKFQQRLAALRNDDWCREYNVSCDPQQMSTELDKIAVGRCQSLAIEVTFSSEGFGPTAQSQLGNEKCFYVFKLTPRLKYREFRESDVQRMFGIATPDTLVTLQVLQGIFAANSGR